MLIVFLFVLTSKYVIQYLISIYLDVEKEDDPSKRKERLRRNVFVHGCCAGLHAVALNLNMSLFHY